MGDKVYMGCNFCGKNNVKTVAFLLDDIEVHICEQCLETMLRELQSGGNAESVEETSYTDIDVKKPRDIKELLDQYVIGQERAKKIISLTLS